MMQVVEDPAALRGERARWRGAGETAALVPTMGDLHAGHLRLVEEARRRAGRVIVSIFVNPMQFDDASDLARYRRQPACDRELLRDAGVDLVFAPAAGVVYPRGSGETARVHVPGLGDTLCGVFRPGHFTGVATVVAILFNLVAPEIAIFGEKDYQQLLLVRRMADDLCFPVEVVGVPTVREPDGLAISSRNRRLSAEERRRARRIHEALLTVAEGLRRQGLAGRERLEREAAEALRADGLDPEYVAVRAAEDLAVPAGGEAALRVLAAARVGAVRLIDNVPVDLG